MICSVLVCSDIVAPSTTCLQQPLLLLIGCPAFELQAWQQQQHQMGQFPQSSPPTGGAGSGSGAAGGGIKIKLKSGTVAGSQNWEEEDDVSALFGVCCT